MAGAPKTSVAISERQVAPPPRRYQSIFRSIRSGKKTQTEQIYMCEEQLAVSNWAEG